MKCDCGLDYEKKDAWKHAYCNGLAATFQRFDSVDKTDDSKLDLSDREKRNAYMREYYRKHKK